MDQDGNCFEVNKIKGRSNNNLLFKEVTEELTEIDLKSLLEMNFSFIGTSNPISHTGLTSNTFAILPLLILDGACDPFRY